MEDSVVLDEYGKKVPGCFRPCKPHCPYTAVIPSITLDTKEGLRDIADCLVHVTSVNTTYYIDDKHRIMTVWAGPVEVDDYDYEENPLGLRSQYVIDRESGRMVYYNAVGDYSVMPLTDPEEQVTKSYVDDQDAEILAEAKAYTDEHGGGGSGDGLFRINVISVNEGAHTFVADKTYAEVLEAYEAGQMPILIDSTESPGGGDEYTVVAPLYAKVILQSEAPGEFQFVSDENTGGNNRINNSHRAYSLGNGYTMCYKSYGSVQVDSALSQESTHAIENQAVYAALQTKANSSSVPVITMTSSDPGEGGTLAANNFIAVYLEGGE